LSDINAASMRSVVIAEGIEAKDKGIGAAMTEQYLAALVKIQSLLKSPAERIQ
jgi:hypothetical protein